MRRLVTLFLIAAAVMMVCENLEAGKTKKGKKDNVKLEKITLEGKIVKEEKEVKTKKGKKLNTIFFIECKDGSKVKLPVRGKKNIDKMNGYVEKDVTVIGKGMTVDGKDGKKVVLRKIEKIEEVGTGDAAGEGDAEEGGEVPLDVGGEE